MEPYDSGNPLCLDAPTLEQVADLAATSAGLQRLCGIESGTFEERKADALEFITIGPTEEPADGGQFTLPELENRGVELNLMAPMEGGKVVITDGLDIMEGGQFLMTARYQVKEAELADRRRLYLGFLDCCSKLERDLANWFAGEDDAIVRNTPRLGGINRVQGPALSPLNYVSTQGEYLYCTWSIPWGDAPGGGGGAEL